MLAIGNGQLEAATYLLAAGVDCEAVRMKDGRTALHMAATRRIPDAVLLLLQHGANVNPTDQQGRTPLDLGETRQIRDELRRAGGQTGIIES